jgi:hypothetical protein
MGRIRIIRKVKAEAVAEKALQEKNNESLQSLVMIMAIGLFIVLAILITFLICRLRKK